MLNGLDERCGRQLPESLEVLQVTHAKRVEIGHVSHQAGGEQLDDTLFAQTFDVHCGTRRKVDNLFARLGRTGRVDAVGVGLFTDSAQLASTLRARRWELPGR